MKPAILLLALAGCPDHPEVLWLAGDATNELVLHLQTSEPQPY
jgi:hypothetical protein